MGPYHEGELEVQRRAGVAANAERVGRIIRREIPEVAQAFAAERRFVILGAADLEGRVWATILHGEQGFLSVPADDRLRIDARPGRGDPLASAFDDEADVGVLIIDPPTRRRMRVNGRVRPVGAHSLEVATREVYSNCPKYIHPREVPLGFGEDDRDLVADRGTALTSAQARALGQADTLFLASRHPVAGADVSHRGGAPGFVRVTAAGRVLIPDYAGNMMFNTLGNLAADPRAGVLLVDFESGGTLQLSGRAEIIWSGAELSAFPGAQRLVEFSVDAVVQRRSGVRERE